MQSVPLETYHLVDMLLVPLIPSLEAVCDDSLITFYSRRISVPREELGGLQLLLREGGGGLTLNIAL